MFFGRLALAKYGVLMNLTQYLLERKGQPIDPVRVIAAHGRFEGTVEKVVWNNFPEHSKIPDEIDIERSWVTIRWDNGSESYNSVDFMQNVMVKDG